MDCQTNAQTEHMIIDSHNLTCLDEMTELSDWTNWNIPCQFLSQMRERTRKCVRGLNELDPVECGITVEQTIERFPCILVEKYNGTRVDDADAVTDSARAMESIPTTSSSATTTTTPTTTTTATTTTLRTTSITESSSTYTKTSTSTPTTTPTTKSVSTTLTTSSTTTSTKSATDRTSTTNSGVGVEMSSTTKSWPKKKPFATYRITFPSDEEHNYSTTTLRPYPIEVIPKRNDADESSKTNSSSNENDTPVTTSKSTTPTTSTIKTTTKDTETNPTTSTSEKSHIPKKSPIFETFIYEYEIAEVENDAEYRTYIYEYIPKPKPKPSFTWANLWLARWFRG